MEKAEERIRSMEKWASENGICFERAKMEWIGLGEREEGESDRIEGAEGEWKVKTDKVRKINGGERVARVIM